MWIVRVCVSLDLILKGADTGDFTVIAPWRRVSLSPTIWRNMPFTRIKSFTVVFSSNLLSFVFRVRTPSCPGDEGVPIVSDRPPNTWFVVDPSAPLGGARRRKLFVTM